MKNWKLNVAITACIPLVALFLTSCSTTSVQPITRVTDVVKPDYIVIYDFAVSTAEVELDRGLGPQIKRELGSSNQTEEQIQVGRAVSKALSMKLVAKLNDVGIAAVPGSPGVRLTERTVSLRGLFTTVDEGNRTARATIGFGLGRSKVRTHGYIYQGIPPDTRQIGEFETVAKSSIKPGMGPAAGAGGSVAVSAASTVVSEKFSTTVEKDAANTAKEIAKQIKKYYVQRGWL